MSFFFGNVNECFNFVLFIGKLLHKSNKLLHLVRENTKTPVFLIHTSVE